MTVSAECSKSSVYIGCAGWGISSRSAMYFPSEGSHLERYSKVLSSVEINSSFYRSHLPETYARWAASVPAEFRFCVKIPRTVTHQLRLRDTDATMHAFIEQVTELGDKLGCLLLQLPPRLALDIPRVQAFFSMARGLTTVPVVCEPRHASWFTPTAAELMEAWRISCVHAHPLPVPGVEPSGDTHILYIRLHGAPRIYYSAYDDAFLDAVAMQIVRARSSRRHVWCTFDNTAEGAAIPNALALMKRLTTMSEFIYA